MKTMKIGIYLLPLLLLAGCATCPSDDTAMMGKDGDEKNIPTPLSVCVDNCAKQHQACHAQGTFTGDTCDAHYQQCVNICYWRYNKSLEGEIEIPEYEKKE